MFDEGTRACYINTHVEEQRRRWYAPCCGTVKSKYQVEKPAAILAGAGEAAAGLIYTALTAKATILRTSDHRVKRPFDNGDSKNGFEPSSISSELKRTA